MIEKNETHKILIAITAMALLLSISTPLFATSQHAQSATQEKHDQRRQDITDPKRDIDSASPRDRDPDESMQSDETATQKKSSREEQVQPRDQKAPSTSY